MRLYTAKKVFQKCLKLFVYFTCILFCCYIFGIVVEFKRKQLLFLLSVCGFAPGLVGAAFEPNEGMYPALDWGWFPTALPLFILNGVWVQPLGLFEALFCSRFPEGRNRERRRPPLVEFASSRVKNEPWINLIFQKFI